MGTREYSVGDRIKADGDYYRIVGKITYADEKNGLPWDEYRLIAENFNNAERWLSIDNVYNEFSLSQINPMAGTLGYHQVDCGRARVVSALGDVDVDVGEEMSFVEYEDSTEEKIVSVENWDDGTEYSSGYYLDPWEFGKDGENVRSSGPSSGGTSKYNIILTVVMAIIFIGAFLSSYAGEILLSFKKIEPYLKKTTTAYTYVTSITGEDKQKANVYEYISGSSLLENYSEEEALMMVAKDIIDGVSGNSDSIQQNTEDDDYTVAILTKKEYCIIYRGDDDKIYVQVSSRKYTYTSDKEPYRSRARTHRYYRRFYYSMGYGSDSGTYSNAHSSYTGYSDGSINYDYNNGLNTYSNDIRQTSVGSRSSDGGGLSSGK
ncbi:MAG: DUF4178 domain-containing protein [Eubacterium sp.]|nr:DUF4178 domain-containing protein [Eubacterium sp.]